mmetsp:Transcript_16535/g.30058  ORF Transcript_16535/g.30058 Transcript_16535/m.30058 type:complete len:751 (+) Transcript_16535:287-2539(+)
MAKLSLIKSVINPTKRTGAKKNLLKRDGITSDGINENDDDSSSLSDRQEKRKSKSKMNFSALKFLRRKGTRNGAEGEDAGYESDASTGSTRSTSSSFLRYQNRAIWRAKLMKKAVLQRLGDGSETPVEDETKPWPMFDRIYKRQNHTLKKGEMGEDEEREYDDDDDSVSSVESIGENCPLGPPAPIITMGLEEEVCMEDVGFKDPCDPDGTSEIAAEKEPQEQGIFSKIRRSFAGRGSSESATEKRSEKIQEGSSGLASSEVSPKKGSDKSQEVINDLASSELASEKTSDESQEDTNALVESTPKESLKGSLKSNPESSPGVSSPIAVQESGIQIDDEKEPADHDSVEMSTPKESLEGPLKSEPSSLPVDSNAVTVQESGIPTSEAPKKSPSKVRFQQDVSQGPQVFPTQKLSQSSPLDITSEENKPKRASAKPPRPSREKKEKKNVSFDGEHEEITPRSIPRTICYSLRSAIGDGSIRQRNSHSLMERRPLRPNGCHLDTSYWSHRGKRNYMEDRFVIEHMGTINKNTENPKPISLLAVFDGHGGMLVSQFCSDWLSSYIRKRNEHFPESLGLAMKTAFIKIDDDFVSSGHLDGTTACACVVVGGKVICCNAGDSRAIIVKRDGTAVALSEDHKPDRDDETKRINDLGGRVIHWGRWRVEGVLAVSRSIGDAKLKPYVTAEPDIVEHDIGEDDMFLVVASDGVWDTMTSDLVAKFVLVNTCKIVDKSLKVDEKLLRWISRQVSKRARSV